MASNEVPALLEALFIYGKARLLDIRTKQNLRLCNKQFKSLVDATVTAPRIDSDTLDDLNALINAEWHGLRKLSILGYSCEPSLSRLPSALFAKFSRLETLKILRCMSLEALPEEIGELAHLKSLEMRNCPSLKALPSSLGHLTTLEDIGLIDCDKLTVEGIAPLQHLTGLTSLTLSYCPKLTKYPDFICNLTSLIELRLASHSITKLPGALGNLTNLETLCLHLEKLQKLPECIGNLNALKTLYINDCLQLATLPESLDDLLWRKAHEKGAAGMERIDFIVSWNVVFSPKMKQDLELMKQNGVEVVVQ